MEYGNNGRDVISREIMKQRDSFDYNGNKKNNERNFIAGEIGK